MSLPLYYRFNSRRSKKPEGYRIVKIKTMLADRPGKYVNFTGFVQWGSTSCTVSDASFVLYRASGVDHPGIAILAGQWSGGTLSYPEIAGGEFAGVDIISGEIYGGDIKSGKLKWSAIFNGSISPEVEQDNCTRDDKPDPWQPATAGEWRFWFNDDNLLAEWFKKI